jgi:hypothetical protein
MMNTLSSASRTALALTGLAWASHVWRALIDATEGFHMGASAGGALLAASGWFTLFLAVWGYALHAAARGSRPAQIASFGLNLLFLVAIPVGTFLFYCTGACYAAADPALVLVNWLNLLLGAAAAVALGLALWPRRTAMVTRS